MANHKSTKKRILVSSRQNLHNRAVKSALKTQMKKLETAVAENSDNLEQVRRETISTIDSAASKGVMHKNAASRKKSQVAKKVAKA